jgi:hypothetical protein
MNLTSPSNDNVIVVVESDSGHSEHLIIITVSILHNACFKRRNTLGAAQTLGESRGYLLVQSSLWDWHFDGYEELP